MPTIDYEVDVPANVIWLKTSLELNGTARSVTVKATGQWTANPATGMVGPDGNAEYTAKPGYTLEGAREGLLVGKVETDGEVFPLGSDGIVPAGSVGDLYLCINDDINAIYGVGFPDNEGVIKVIITVEVDAPGGG